MAVQKIVVVIYKVMYTEHCKKTLRIEAIVLSTLNHLIDFVVYALAGCRNFIIICYMIVFKKIFQVHFWVFKFDAT